jgi:hypothetical protein
MFSIFFHSNDLGFTCKVFIALSLCPPTIDLMKVIHAFNVVIDNWPALNLIKSNEKIQHVGIHCVMKISAVKSPKCNFHHYFLLYIVVELKKVKEF